MVGSRTAPFRWGTAVFAPDFPLRHDSNYLLVRDLPASVDPAALANEADRIQGAAGLDHRCLMFPDAASGERMAEGLAALGWVVHRGVIMAHRRPPVRTLDTTLVVETAAEALREAREAQIRDYPWGTPEVAAQLLGVEALRPVPVRHYAVFVDGAPVSWAETYVGGDVAQIEAVATDAAFRGKGYASRVVLRAVEDARSGGADLVFLCADAADWPRELYARLGFDEIGRYVKFSHDRVGHGRP
jgi:GNAT superfamily N-acetyltransferase